MSACLDESSIACELLASCKYREPHRFNLHRCGMYRFPAVLRAQRKVWNREHLIPKGPIDLPLAVGAGFAPFKAMVVRSQCTIA
jgi:hypothetical protein